MSIQNHYFLKMIQRLRQKEEVMLYGNVFQIPEQEVNRVVQFLETEYHKEKLSFPYTPPAYDAQAALWAAKTVYYAAQLLLYREQKIIDLPNLIPDFTTPITASAILSADLCLRFLPDLIIQLRLIDPEDALPPILEKLLGTWHYSALSLPNLLGKETSAWELILQNDCLRQLYVNRVIQHKHTALAQTEPLQIWVKASLGDYQKELASWF